MSKIQSLIVASITLALPVNFLMMIPKAHAANYYGAIAYSPQTGMIGYSYDYTSLSSAKSAALSKCRNASGSNDCTIAASVQNGCIALATTPNGGYSGGWDANKSGALFNALQSCRQHNRSCSISQWLCTTR